MKEVKGSYSCWGMKTNCDETEYKMVAGNEKEDLVCVWCKKKKKEKNSSLDWFW